MRNINQIMKQLFSAGIDLYLCDGKLKAQVPPQGIAADLQQLIRDEKPQIIAFLQRYQQAEQNLPTVEITAVSREQALPLSYAQQRFWVTNRMEDGTALHNIPVALKITGELNPKDVEQAFKTIIERHETLRTVYADEGEQTVQRVRDQVEFKLEQVDMTGHPLSSRSVAVTQAVFEQSARTFDLSQDVMIRACVYRVAEVEHLLFINMHHIATDGWSTGILLQEFVTLYQAYSNKQPNPLKSLPVQYADFAHWQRNHIDQAVLDNQLKYWQQQLHDLPVLHQLPTDRPRPLAPQHNVDHHHAQIKGPLLSKVEVLCAEHKVTMLCFVQTVFALLLSKHSKRQDIVMGLPVSGRNQSALTEMIGCFINILVVRTDVDETLTFKQLLESQKDTFLQAFDHQDLPFDQLVDKLNLPRHSSYTPLFQVMINELQTDDDNFEMPGVSIEFVDDSEANNDYDLELGVAHHTGKLNLNWLYSAQLFDLPRVKSLSDNLVSLIEQVIDEPEIMLNQLVLQDTDHLQGVVTDLADLNQQVAEQSEYVAPQTEQQQQLADLWSKLLKKPQVGIHDNFFALGGNSMMVIRLISKAKKLGVTVKPEAFFAAPTIAALLGEAEQGDVAKRHRDAFYEDDDLEEVEL